MDYAKFVSLVNEGEKSNIDFKIRCDAFIASAKAAKAELAKDICAMANNGNIASYIIVGISDDGSKFEPVQNPYLTDDIFQDFCKKSIFPPPKIKVYKEKWTRVKKEHKNIGFVIIQIGPQKRQAFRLNQDFIDYRGGFCLRRNEVWIRRGTTSDLGTPEEIAKLVEGKPFEFDPEYSRMVPIRDEFSKLSVGEKNHKIITEMGVVLKHNGYFKVSQRERNKSLDIWKGGKFYPLYWKSTDSNFVLITTLGCWEILNKSDLEIFRMYGMTEYISNNSIPIRAMNKCGGVALSVRRIGLISILSKLTRHKIQSALQEWHWSGNGLHFYLPTLKKWHNNDEFLPSSAELLIVDDILSVSDFDNKLSEALIDLEKNTDTIVQLPI